MYLLFEVIQYISVAIILELGNDHEYCSLNIYLFQPGS